MLDAGLGARSGRRTMQTPSCPRILLTVALAAVAGAGHARCRLGAAKKKHRATAPSPAQRGPRSGRGLVPVDERHARHHAGLPPAADARRKTPATAERARRPPGAYPARQQHLHSAAQSVAVFGQQPAGCGADPARSRAVQPPPITTFSDRVNSAIQAYPLEKGIGNNPTDQQMFIRQRINQSTRAVFVRSGTSRP